MIVSNATSLIYLARVNKLDLLEQVFGGVVIPEEVKMEVVDRGKEREKQDAYLVEKAIKDGWIKVSNARQIEIPIPLGKGEEAAISLAKNLGIGGILIDESRGRTVAGIMGLKAKGTIFVLLKAVERGLMDFDDFLKTLEILIKEGFRLREEVYVSIWETSYPKN
jgi:predicted nucleic acid-binding protein